MQAGSYFLSGPEGQGQRKGQRDMYRNRETETGTEEQDRGTGQRNRVSDKDRDMDRGTSVPPLFMQARGDCTMEHLKLGFLRETPAYL